MHVQYEMIQCSSFREEVQSVYLVIYMLNLSLIKTVPDYCCTTTDI